MSHFYHYNTMTYHDQLHPWVVYRLLPNCETVAIARFRRRNDAEMYLATLQRQMPDVRLAIAFEPPEALPTDCEVPDTINQGKLQRPYGRARG
ncbi:hypothetical protein [Leptolyngbya sp. FACHB-671]|uniref:hypothetical protein n=1 Tax=Leptolyngbya sp. FACHB-671 TaxID=2692812 RepID=UPI0019C34BD1|nr:hypothetical protein [Leptolyngbya sp. FACHB-671]MBD1867766.1 hypothetical protein [Cyanobacteria bacterium FACHB-471]